MVNQIVYLVSYLPGPRHLLSLSATTDAFSRKSPVNGKDLLIICPFPLQWLSHLVSKGVKLQGYTLWCGFSVGLSIRAACLQEVSGCHVHTFKVSTVVKKYLLVCVKVNQCTTPCPRSQMRSWDPHRPETLIHTPMEISHPRKGEGG